MVFAKGLSGERVDMVVTKDVMLHDVQTVIHVKKVGEDNPMFISQNNLLLDRGLIFCIPKSMYTISSDQVFFNEIFEDSIMDLVNQTGLIHSDEDWASLMDLETTSSKRKGNEMEQTSLNPKSKKEKKECSLLHETWKKLLPPSEEKPWVSCIYKKNNHHQLILGQLKQRFRYDSDLSELDKCEWEVSCCKPYDMDVDFVEEGTREEDGSPGELWNFMVSDIIMSNVHVTYLEHGKWKVNNKDEVKNIFDYAVEADRKAMLMHDINLSFG